MTVVKRHFTIGIDFGSLSARGILADVENGETFYQTVCQYPHGIMDRMLPEGNVVLRDGWALQHPQDYLDALKDILIELTDQVQPEQIVGIGLDCTSSTIMPVRADGTPLCELPQHHFSPFSYIMMWKHHGASFYADEMTRIALERNEDFLKYYGNIVNSECTMPRLLHSLKEAPDIYYNADRYIEVVDWLIWQLTGHLIRSEACMGYKTFYRKGSFPSREYLSALDEKFADVYEEKLSGPIVPAGKSAGCVDASAAERYHLPAGIPVSAGMIDAHAGVPAAGITENGVMLSIVGTSTCHIVGADCERCVPGISGAVADGVLPGSVWYEGGQSSVGDCFEWFTRHCVPETYYRQAKDNSISVHTLLTQKAEKLRPGQNGLLVLDWWNGNRSILSDANLSGMILGLTLQTLPEEIYRSLIEATAFGAREIIENFQNHGIEVHEIRVSGGISQKNSMAMQIYADILHMPLKILKASQGPALGSAIYAAAAAGCYPTLAATVKAMGSPIEKIYVPDEDNSIIYHRLYQEYHRLHDYFGRGENSVMAVLKELRNR